LTPKARFFSDLPRPEKDAEAQGAGDVFLRRGHERVLIRHPDPVRSRRS
jgi:hypothetical protein